MINSPFPGNRGLGKEGAVTPQSNPQQLIESSLQKISVTLEEIAENQL